MKNQGWGGGFDFESKNDKIENNFGNWNLKKFESKNFKSKNFESEFESKFFKKLE